MKTIDWDITQNKQNTAARDSEIVALPYILVCISYGGMELLLLAYTLNIPTCSCLVSS